MRSGEPGVVCTIRPMPSTSEGPAHQQPKGWFRRNAPVLQILLSVLLIAVVVGVGVLWFQHRRSGSEASAQKSSQSSVAPLPPPPPPVCGDDAALMNMPLETKLAQLLMVGVTGAEDTRNVVARYHVGGIFIGSGTDKSMLKDQSLLQQLRTATPLPVGVSVDEEGGRVDRLASLISPAPSARSLVQTHMPLDQVREMAKQRGLAMANLGITVDFAPVADTSDQADDTVIGDRSFSNDPQVVREYALAYSQGLRDANITPVFKHFPGHGHASGDSHTGSVTTPPLEVLKQRDLIPYQTLLTEPKVAAMVGHMIVPNLTDDQQQASLSKAAYDLLRSGDYGGQPFNGVVFTDDLSSMKAITDIYTVPQAVLKALQAGADVALWVTTDEVPAVLERLKAAVPNELSMERVDASLRRVAAMKGRGPQC
ncbi:MAG: beta-N-acetylhexosaminidase [Mycobacterium sp.]|nr:beta-N-acetylhexosaminidase [Mycobacterium sp.]